MMSSRIWETYRKIAIAALPHGLPGQARNDK
jgi:hypothetical protein